MQSNRLLRQVLLAASIFLLLFPCAAQGSAADPVCVANLRAEANGTGGVRLSWSLPEGPARGKVLFYAIYRDQRPIYSSTRIRSLFPIAAVPKTHISYIDETDDGASYYYAVLTFVDEKEADGAYQDLYYDEILDGPDGESRVQEDSGMLYTVILPGINATISPIKAAAAVPPASVTEALRDAGTARGAELTRADAFQNEAFLREEEETLHKERSISIATERQVSDLRSGTPSGRKAVPLFRHIFSEDQLPPSGGDDYLLYAILQETLLAYRYQEARADLTDFLAQHRDAGVTARATFYLAEAEYFMGNYAEALKLFAEVQDRYPPLAGKWIDSCLDLR